MTGPTVCETRWSTIVATFQKNRDDLLTRHPDCIEEIDLLQTALLTIGQLIHISPPVNGDDAVWKELIANSETERRVLCKHMEGKALFTAMLRMYAAIHRGLRESLLPVHQQSSEEFCEQRRRKRNSSEEQVNKSKTMVPTPESRDPIVRSQGQIPTKNFFVPLRTSEMDVELALGEETSDNPNGEQPSSSK
jgi:hypothetical protein